MHGSAASVRPSLIDLPDFRKNGSVRYNHKPSLRTLYTCGKIEEFTYDYISTFWPKQNKRKLKRDCANSFFSVCFLCMLFTKDTSLYIQSILKNLKESAFNMSFYLDVAFAML